MKLDLEDFRTVVAGQGKVEGIFLGIDELAGDCAFAGRKIGVEWVVSRVAAGEKGEGKQGGDE